MILLNPPPEPLDFKDKVENKGQKWLVDHPDAEASKFPDYWNEVREQVQDAFDGCCAYLGFPIPSGQIDHFLPKDEYRDRAYKWANYRWSEPRVNLLKRTLTFLDPFEIGEDWVTIDPVTLEYQVTDTLPARLTQAGSNTIKVLNDPELVRGRRNMLGKLTRNNETWDIDRLQYFFPLLARAVNAIEPKG
ncbi:conserved hypothetical protein [uncultured Gammaproteobacteria bacterium]